MRRLPKKREVSANPALPIGLYGLTVCGVVVYLAVFSPKNVTTRVFIPDNRPVTG